MIEIIFVWSDKNLIYAMRESVRPSIQMAALPSGGKFFIEPQAEKMFA